jgi:single-strand DNA-binding protein
MSDLNSVVLVGRLVRDPELRYTPQGAAVCEFILATNRRFTKKDGEKVDEVAFIDVVAWNRLAEISAEYLKKGRMVVVLGQLTQDRWEDKDSGQKRSRIRILASTVQFLGGGSKDGETSDAEVPAEDPPAASEAPPAPPKPVPQKARAGGKR